MEWGLRDYGEETVRIWGGDSECDHEWIEDSTKFTRGDQSGLPKYIRADTGKPTGGAKKHPQIKEDLEKVQPSDFCSICGAWRGSLGLEPHPQLFIDHLVEICREIKRVLKPSGTFWLNLGDTYCSSGKWVNKELGDIGKQNRSVEGGSVDAYSMRGRLKQDGGWIQPKQKLMIPSRVAIALQHDGWILRNDIIWFKPNHMPSSVKDRFTCAYEHIFLFVKNNEAIYWVDRFTGQLTSSKPRQYYVHDESGEKRFDRPIKGVDKDWFNEKGIAKFKYAWQGHDYYFDLDAIRKPQKSIMEKHEGNSLYRTGHPSSWSTNHRELNPKGKNPGDIWNIDAPIISDSRKALHGPTYRRHQLSIKGGQAIGLSPKGKNPGDLWRIPTTPFPGTHFSTFPPKLIEPIVKAGCPRWICSRCGKPRTRITERVESGYDGKQHHFGRKSHGAMKSNIEETGIGGKESPFYSAKTVGWSDCECGEKWVGGVVLDPFAGSGTALRVARKLGRRFIGIEISPKYAEMARQRVRADKYKDPLEGVSSLKEILK